MVDEPIRTLIVEDDPLLADAHRLYVERVPGFTVCGVARSGTEALRVALADRPDLLLLDFYLPGMSGLEVCRALRAHGATADIIAVTSARDLATVRAAVSYGVVQYLVKPFSFAAFRQRLERYAAFHRQTTADPAGPVGQHEVDSALAVLRPDTARSAHQPKGLSTATLDAVVACLRAAQNPVSADDVAEELGMARVTARRYLERLTGQRLATRTQRYGRSGRPGHLYRWSGA
ncbi:MULTISPECIES: response regulator [Frankia]|uniref:Transcriptional regulatory protein n=1 Tax=Frankia alni (strain DSM 45986 / CECT 9034 / ACN14a) TaxID=326424 RepID=Q0RLG9_FRAAA|nr:MULTISPECIES: response regulator [Frankia]CAJ61635.1 putative two-component system response regulator [Frankia alni ACN14a]